jgi:hypothetical protein
MARAGHLAEGEQGLRESEVVLHAPALSAEGRLIVESFNEAVAAYLDFRRGDERRARDRIHGALRIDTALIAQHGYEVLELHRIQLVHNLIRIETRFGDAVAAVQMSADLLAYLEGDVARWPARAVAAAGTPGRVAADLRAAMFIQVTGEMVLFLSATRRGELTRRFAPLLAHANLVETAGCREHPRAHDWFAVKAVYVSDDATGFLESAARFLDGGPDAAPLLWQGVATDVAEFCRELDTAEAAAIADEIASDAQRWTGRVPGVRRDRAPPPAASIPARVAVDSPPT